MMRERFRSQPRIKAVFRWIRNLALVALVLCPALARAQRGPLPATRTIAEYNVDDVTLRVSADAPRVEVFLWRNPHAIVVYLDSPSVEQWIDSAAAFVRDENAPARISGETSTRILRHTDASYRSGLMFTRESMHDRNRLFLAAFLGEHSAIMVPMRTSQARGFLAALRDAARVARRARE
jgi:hypothetical protein